VSHVFAVSQACSCMTLLEKKMLEAVRMPLMRVCQVEFP